MAVYDRASELKAFDSARTGVKGLVDAGATSIPRIFIHPPSSTDSAATGCSQTKEEKSIPVVDLSSHREHTSLVQDIGDAAEGFGMFYVEGHGIPAEVLDDMLAGVRRFHEQEAEPKMEFYTRESTRKVIFNTNFDFYSSPAANWRDTLTCIMAPEPPALAEIPAVCREIIIQYATHIQKLGAVIFELLSEYLGLEPEHLKEMECSKGLFLVCHYYPPCPEPDLTLGVTKHSDNDFLTILLPDNNISGLQVLHGDQWINVHPRPGALVVNIGDLLQLITNDKLKSVQHRVLANKVGPRVSAASFFSSRLFPSSRLYGPIKELMSDENPPKYWEVTEKEFATYYISKGLDGKHALDYFRL